MTVTWQDIAAALRDLFASEEPDEGIAPLYETLDALLDAMTPEQLQRVRGRLANVLEGVDGHLDEETKYTE